MYIDAITNQSFYGSFYSFTFTETLDSQYRKGKLLNFETTFTLYNTNIYIYYKYTFILRTQVLSLKITCYYHSHNIFPGPNDPWFILKKHSKRVFFFFLFFNKVCVAFTFCQSKYKKEKALLFHCA